MFILYSISISGSQTACVSAAVASTSGFRAAVRTPPNNGGPYTKKHPLVKSAATSRQAGISEYMIPKTSKFLASIQNIYI